MPTFYYKAKTMAAETVIGQLVAENQKEAVEKINQLSLMPVVVVESGMTAGQKGLIRLERVTPKELYLFSRQMVNLLKAGVPILSSLDILISQSRNLYFRRVLENIRLGINSGRSFSDCLNEYPRIFFSLYVVMVRVGEESGTLKETIADVSEYLRRQNELSEKIRLAMAYPILMGVLGVVTVIFILSYVMPQITGLFDRLNQGLPWPTVFVMKLSSFIVDGGLWLVGILVIAVASWKKFAKSASGQTFKSRLVLGVPLLRDFYLKLELGRFCRTAALLLKSGVSIVRALQLAIPSIGNEILREQLRKCQGDLVAGRTWGDSLKEASMVPPLMGHLISVGEASGSLRETLQDVADTYEQDTQENLKFLTTLLEPIMIIVVGAIIGFLIIAMLLPIFQMDIFAG